MTLVRVVVSAASVVLRADVARVLDRDGDVRVVGSAESADEVVRMVPALRPHVVVVVVEDSADGIRALARAVDVPVVALACRDAHAAVAVDCFDAGAADVLVLPSSRDRAGAAVLRGHVIALAGGGVRARAQRRARALPVPARPAPEATRASGRPAPPVPAARGSAGSVLAIGASTGGPAALADLLADLGQVEAAILVVQHLHPDFIDGLVTWLGGRCAMPVRVASAGPAAPGVVHVAPGGQHLRLAGHRRLVLSPTPERLHRPSVDELFNSVAESAGASAVGVLLTGMGEDGARGLLHMRQAGAWTAAQDEASSAVWGMPQAAVRHGAATAVLPLAELGPAVRRALAAASTSGSVRP